MNSNTNLPKSISLNKYKELVKLNEKLKYNPYLEYDYITNKFLDKRYHTISVRRDKEK